VWQTGYYERILRETDDTYELMVYLLNNPLRAQLAKDISEWEHFGSSVYSIRN
jgi:hypothetical protein